MEKYKEDTNNNLKQKLLIIEDDIVTVGLVKRLLKNKYDIDSIDNGEDAFEKAKENDYDAFLVDIGLPGKMNGVQTTQKIKGIKKNNDKPFIAVTAYAMPGDKEFFLSEGLTHYISKPFEFHDLIELIESVLLQTKKMNV